MSRRTTCAMAFLLAMAAAEGPAAADHPAGIPAMAAPPVAGSWASENVLWLADVDPEEELPVEFLEEVITAFAFLPDGTWRVREEDPLGVMCFHTALAWAVEGDTLRVPGRPDLRWHFNLNDNHSLLILTSPVGSVGAYVAFDAPVDTTGCQYDPEMLPFW